MFLKQYFPQYVLYDGVFDETLCEVPKQDIKRHYRPSERLQEIRRSSKPDRLEKAALEFFEQLRKQAKMSWDDCGISGSLLIKLHTPKSDIDPIVYGSNSCRKTYAALTNLLKSEKRSFKPYTLRELKTLFDFRSKDTMTGFEDFVRTESRKVLQGRFAGVDYFVRFVKDWSEINESYGDVQYANAGYARIKAIMVNDEESIFTPCTYKVNNVQILEGFRTERIEEIASFRGRFCEQARVGETVVAQGKVERVIDTRSSREYFRVLLGNKPSDFMVLA
jgi:predicted nucleotidyltransferase